MWPGKYQTFNLLCKQENQCWEEVRVSTNSETIRVTDPGGPRDQETLVMGFVGFKQDRIVTTALGSNPTAISVNGKTPTDSGIRAPRAACYSIIHFSCAFCGTEQLTSQIFYSYRLGN